MVSKWIIFMKMAQWENTSSQGIMLEQVGNHSIQWWHHRGTWGLVPQDPKSLLSKKNKMKLD